MLQKKYLDNQWLDKNILLPLGEVFRMEDHMSHAPYRYAGPGIISVFKCKKDTTRTSPHRQDAVADSFC